MFKHFILAAIIILFSAVLSASALAYAFEDEFKQAADDSTALEIVHKYLVQMQNVEDLRVLQSYWQSVNPTACSNYFKDMLQQNPKSSQYIYLWARIQDDPKVQIYYGRELVKQFPEFEYGYRLLLTTYQNSLFGTPDPAHPSARELLPDYKKDKKYFAQFVKKFKDSEIPLYLYIGMLVWENNVKEANKQLAIAQDTGYSWLTWQFFTNFYLKTDQIALLQAYLRRMVDTSSITKGLTPEEKELQFEQAYLTTLLAGEAYTYFFDYVNANPHVLNDQNGQTMYLIACALHGQPDLAFSLLDKLADNSGNLYQWLLSDHDLDALRQDARWEPLMLRFKAAWQASSNSRKIEVLAKKFSRPAPPWELKDAQGNLVRLEDLRGNIIILDFWATWCGPCKQAMPVLDNWMKTKMPRDVKVFSINVWERDKAKVLPTMTDNNYAMTLLWGSNNLSTDYNFDGIPYICVIDKLGNIRFEENGFTNDLAENLTFWVEDLLAEGK